MSNKKRLVISFLLVLFIFGVSLPLFITNQRKIKADTITDLTSTTWLLNDEISWINNDGFSDEIEINFNSNNYSFNSIVFENVDEDFDDYYLGFKTITPYNYITCYYSSGSYGYNNLNVTDNDYQEIEITGGTDVTNSNLISWLQSNATQVIQGTQITYHYWSPDGVITMSDNEVYYDTDIEYLIRYNEYRSEQYEDTQQTGLRFIGKTENHEHSYIQAYNGTGYNQLYYGDTNNINNAMWLEFSIGDTMDTDLYNFMSLWGTWFNDANAYLCGTNQGYAEGTIHGRALGQADGTQYEGLITGIFNGLGGILSIQVFPNITIALLIGLPLLLGVFIIIIKILRG